MDQIFLSMDREGNKGIHRGSNVYVVKLYYLVLQMDDRKRCNQVHEGVNNCSGCIR
jgi:hypothetical protein